jgi:hypothetical protein
MKIYADIVVTENSITGNSEKLELLPGFNRFGRGLVYIGNKIVIIHLNLARIVSQKTVT